MTVCFQTETLDAVRGEVLPLLQAHFEEIAHFQDIPLDPEWEVYDALEMNGALRIYTVRDNDATLVGYAVFFVRRSPHYRGSLQAVQDILFLVPALRGQMLGARFVRWCDDQLRVEGVQVVRHHVKAAHDFGPLLERLGYELEDRIYVRRLDRPARVARETILAAHAGLGSEGV